MKCLIFFFSILFLSLITSSASASWTIGTNQNFLINGEWKHFTQEHTFTTVYKDSNGIWYFDGQTYDQIETPSTPSWSAIVISFNQALVILSIIPLIAAVGILIVAVKMRETIDLKLLIALIGFVVLIVMAVVILNLTFVSLGGA